MIIAQLTIGDRHMAWEHRDGLTLDEYCELLLKPALRGLLKEYTGQEQEPAAENPEN